MNHQYSLSLEVLKREEELFKIFLISRGIDSVEREIIKSENPEKLDGLLTMFSDYYLNHLLETHRYYLLKSSTLISALRLDDSGISYFQLKLENILNDQMNTHGTLQHFNTSYTQSPKEHLFQLIELGYQPVESRYFNDLALKYAEQIELK